MARYRDQPLTTHVPWPLATGAARVGADELFVLRNPIAEGHIEHQLWIIDPLVILGRAARNPDLLLPAWALQRRFVLTNNLRRRDALRTRAEPLPLPVIVELLPQAPVGQA